MMLDLGVGKVESTAGPLGLLQLQLSHSANLGTWKDWSRSHRSTERQVTGTPPTSTPLQEVERDTVI